MLLKDVSKQLLNLRPYLENGQVYLGEIQIRDDIKSTMGPFRSMPQYKTVYPPVVVKALLELYQEYNNQFVSLVAKNREWESDYQYCIDKDGIPCNRWVQVDMVGLPEKFLQIVPNFKLSDVKEMLRHWIFEIENSLAMYQLLECVTPNPQFRFTFRNSLNELREKYKMPIALLTVTNEKYKSLLADEFGWTSAELIPDQEVKKLSGFDKVFNPDTFCQHVDSNGGKSKYLLYVRSSDPIERLKNPKVQINHPLLSDDRLRRIIKAHSLTLNIDDPAGTSDKINDTKAYLSPMEMAYEIDRIDDLLSSDFLNFMSNGGAYANYSGEYLTDNFQNYLMSIDVDPMLVIDGSYKLRAKPLRGTYGCYGHQVFALNDREQRKQVKAELKKRGRYVVQIEMPMPVITDTKTGDTFGYFDRNFFTIQNDRSVFMGGLRSLLPSGSNESKRGRFHGNQETVWAEITG